MMWAYIVCPAGPSSIETCQPSASARADESLDGFDGFDLHESWVMLRDNSNQILNVKIHSRIRRYSKAFFVYLLFLWSESNGRILHPLWVSN